MCSTINHLQLCSCSGENVTQEKLYEEARGSNGKILIWALHKYLGRKESRIMGKIIPAITQLNETITLEFVLEELNTRNCFDFEYTPQPNDKLTISTYIDNNYNYMTVLFKKEKWVLGTHPAFTSRLELINYGKAITVKQTA